MLRFVMMCYDQMRLSHVKFNRVHRGKFLTVIFLYDEGDYHDWFQGLISNDKI